MNFQALMLIVLLCTPLRAQRNVEPTEWSVEGVNRQALVISPSQATSEPAPVIFVFHGHGGTMNNSLRLGFQRQWPEAWVVCPQGLPTVTSRDPEGQRSGWQPKLGQNSDRDLKFFDAMLTTLIEKNSVDKNRVFITGHSNGGGFTYLLWIARGQQLAAIAPSAAGSANLQTVKELVELPVMHLAGKSDQIVPFDLQDKTMAAVRHLNQCEDRSKAYGKIGDLVAMQYDSPKGTPLVSVIHPGGHKYPESAPELIVKFFKEHQREQQE